MGHLQNPPPKNGVEWPDVRASPEEAATEPR